MTSDKSLKRLYNRLNHQYFGSQLPEDLVIWWEPCQDAFGVTHEIDDPEEGERFLGIKIDPQLAFSWALTKGRVLHEMAHAAVWCKDRSPKEHSKMFWDEMDRLWQIGAFRKEGCL